MLKAAGHHEIAEISRICRGRMPGGAEVGPWPVDAETVQSSDSSPMDATSLTRTQSHWRTVGRIAIAMVFIPAAGVDYLGSTSTSQSSALRSEYPPHAQGRPVTFPYVVTSPAPSAQASPLSLVLPLSGNISVLIEQFAGGNDQLHHGQESVYITDVTAISRLVHELNALPVFPNGIVSCADYVGAYFGLVFRYADGSKIGVRVETGGCGRVYLSGSLQPVAWILTSPQLIDTFKGLLARGSQAR